ncbi:hypothetical protein EJB05_13891, partial [Eragrostis curvula]
MAMATRDQRRRLEEDDLISRLPDAILGEIISLLPTIDGACTQAVSSRWRHLWSSAPLNLDLHEHPPTWRRIPFSDISGILSAHSGPGRRFAVPMRYFVYNKDPAATMDDWLRFPALDNLQEIEFHLGGGPYGFPPHPPLPAALRRFSATLRVASFGGCNFPDGALHLPLVKQLSLLNVGIAEESLNALFDGCPVLESLLLTQDMDTAMVISVISAPSLRILGQLPVDKPRLEFGTTTFQGSHVVKSMTPVNNVKVLALTHMYLSLDSVINFMKCLPCLEKLYIKMSKTYETEEPAERNAWCRKYRNITSSLDISLKEIVLTTYRGNKAHVNFAKFFVLNARVLESMVLDVHIKNDNIEWIERQQRLLQITSRASRDARFDFVSHLGRPKREKSWYGQVHNLSMADPFVGFDKWT